MTDQQKGSSKPTKDKKITARNACIAIVAAILVGGGIAIAVWPRASAVVETVEPPPTEPEKVLVRAVCEEWTDQEDPIRVKISDERGEVVAEREISANEDQEVATLTPGIYAVELASPVLLDGTVFPRLSPARVVVVSEAEEQPSDDASHDADSRSAILEASLAPIPSDEVTEDAVDTAVDAYARSEDERAALKERAMEKIDRAKGEDGAAEDDKLKEAEEAAANGTATPEQIAAVEAAGKSAPPDSYSNSGASSSPSSPPASSSGSNESTPGSTPVDDRYEGNPKYGYWTSVEKWVCNTCGAEFSSLAALQAHQKATQDAWLAGEGGQVHGGYSYYSTPVWVWY